MSEKRDILNQMMIELANGESLILFDVRDLAEKNGDREQREAARMDTLLRLGITEFQEGPLAVTDVGVTVA